MTLTRCRYPFAERFVYFSIILLLFFFATQAVPFAFGQGELATVFGRVTDPTGAVIVGAEVEIKNVETNVTANHTTNGDGLYTIPALHPGHYVLSVRRQGFKTVTLTQIELNVQDNVVRNFTLQVGSSSESITVEGGVTLVNTESAAVGTVVDRQFVENMPLNGRSFQSLITLTPGVVLVPALNSSTGQGQFSVNGQRNDANYFVVDGVSANIGNGITKPGTGPDASTSGSLPGLTALGTTQSLVSVDAMQEFKVQTSSYSAEYGRSPGGQISIVSRGGANAFHGSAFDYLRNEAFDANNWFSNRSAVARQAERQQDFGGTFGGPVWLPGLYHGRDRTFFFVSYEGQRLQTPTFLQTFYPSATYRSTAPAAMQPLLKAFPLPGPNAVDAGAGFASYPAGFSNPSHLNATSVRIDHSFNQKLTVFGRFSDAPSANLSHAAANLATEIAQQVDTKTLTVGATAKLRSNIINEARFNYSDNGGFNVNTLTNFGGAVPFARELVVPTQYLPAGAVGQLNVSFLTPASPAGVNINLSTFSQSQRQFNVVDSVSWALGSHRLKFGVDYRRLTPPLEPRAYTLTYSFANQAQVLASTAGTVGVTVQKGAQPIFTNTSLYAEDTWKLGQRLTLDLGLRWDVNPPPGEATGTPPYTVTGLDNPKTAKLAPPGTPLWQTTYNNFAPRIGVAYLLRPSSNYETVVRGGFGVFYDAGNNLGAIGFASTPYGNSFFLSNVPYPANPTQIAPPAITIPPVPPIGTIWTFDPNLKLPYTLQWSVGVEQGMGANQALTLSYIGNAGRRLLQMHQMSVTSINTNGLTFLELTTNQATSDYDALQTQYQRRLSHGLQVLASYTWSHAMDWDSADVATLTPVRGNSAFDIRHVFATAVTYDFPRPGPNRFVNAVVGQWSVDTNLHFQTGAPVDIRGTTVVNPADGSNQSSRPNVNPGVPFYLADPTVPGGMKINRLAFTSLPAGQFGNLGRNQVRSPFRYVQQDLALRRQFKLTEGLKLQFRAEAFNIFNHPNFGAIQTGLTSTTFGQATNLLGSQLGGLNALFQSGGPRSLQFALKLLF